MPITTLEAVKILRTRIETRLCEKASWGRNEIKAMLQEEYEKVLELLIEVR